MTLHYDKRGRTPYERAEQLKNLILLTALSLVISLTSLIAAIAASMLGIRLEHQAPTIAHFIFGPVEWLTAMLGANWGETFTRTHLFIACVLCGPIWVAN